jgi:P pilus assembly chaperone PapD
MKHLAILAILAATLTGSASAGVGPNAIRVDLKQPSKTIQFESTEAVPVRFEAVVFKWTAEGLEPTKEVIAYPPVFEVAPDSKQAIKVMSRKPRGEAEGTYRLVFKAIEGAGVNISVPVFLPPAVPGKAVISAKRESGVITLTNTGNVTERITKTYMGGKQIPADVLLYVLPGQTVQIEDTERRIEKLTGDQLAVEVQ